MVHLEPAGQKLSVVYSKDIVGNRLHELFNKDEIVGMLEVSDYDPMNKLYSFLERIVDNLIGIVTL